MLRVYDRETKSYSYPAPLMFSQMIHFLMFFRVASLVVLLADILPVSLNTFCHR